MIKWILKNIIGAEPYTCIFPCCLIPFCIILFIFFVKSIILSEIPNTCVIIQERESIDVNFRKCWVFFLIFITEYICLGQKLTVFSQFNHQCYHINFKTMCSFFYELFPLTDTPSFLTSADKTHCQVHRAGVS